MNVQTSQSGGWRCSAELVNGGDEHSVTLELDSNMGGMWPRVVVQMSAGVAVDTEGVANVHNAERS